MVKRFSGCVNATIQRFAGLLIRSCARIAGEQKSVTQSKDLKSPKTVHYVIIGNSVAGTTAAFTLRQRESAASISLVSGESDFFFSCTALMYAYGPDGIARLRALRATL